MRWELLSSPTVEFNLTNVGSLIGNVSSLVFSVALFLAMKQREPVLRFRRCVGFGAADVSVDTDWSASFDGPDSPDSSSFVFVTREMETLLL